VRPVRSVNKVPPRVPTEDPDYGTLQNRSRYTHYYFYIRDEIRHRALQSVLGAWGNDIDKLLSVLGCNAQVVQER
jgi:hypothetical protein